MTTVEAEAARIFSDARHMRDAALAQMAAGDVRDAAEKAWCATLRATEALVLVRTGEGPSTSTAAGRRLRALSMSDQSLLNLRDRYPCARPYFTASASTTIIATRRKRNASYARLRTTSGTLRRLAQA